MSYTDLLSETKLIVEAPASTELVSALNKVLADVYVFYFKAHSFHWNVVGKDFPQLHKFFGKIYEEVFDEIDVIAEHIRTLDVMAPMNLTSLISNASFSENTTVLDSAGMVSALESDNTKLLANLLACAKLAEAANDIGLNDYLTQLYDKHKKLAWMLSSTLKV
jgi:starvation-inducible DNA-binding protein